MGGGDTQHFPTLLPCLHAWPLYPRLALSDTHTPSPYREPGSLRKRCCTIHTKAEGSLLPPFIAKRMTGLGQGLGQGQGSCQEAFGPELIRFGSVWALAGYITPLPTCGVYHTPANLREGTVPNDSTDAETQGENPASAEVSAHVRACAVNSKESIRYDSSRPVSHPYQPAGAMQC